MSIIAAVPAHNPSWSRDSLSEESVDTHSTEIHGSYPPPPIAPHASPYRGITAAAFTDINRALAVRSLRESVVVSSGNLPSTKCAARTGSYIRSPPSFPGPSPTRHENITEQQSDQSVLRPKAIRRPRSMTMPLKAWAPLRSKRAATHLPGTQESLDVVALGSERREVGSNGAPLLGDNQLGKEKETPHSGILLQDTKPARKRRSTVHCIIM